MVFSVSAVVLQGCEDWQWKAGEKVGNEKERICRKKRRDEGAASWGEGVHCEWLMRQGFWVHLPSKKNGLIHPFLSLRLTEPHSSDRAGFWKFLFNGRFWRRSDGISAKLAPSHLQPLWCCLFGSLLLYLCLVPVPLFTYLQTHTLYCVISPGDHPLSPVSFSLQTFPHSCCIPIILFSPFPHSSAFCLFFPLSRHRVTPVGGECSCRL